MAYERLSAHDRSFLDIENPRTPMHVGGVFLFEAGPLTGSGGGIDIDAIQAMVESRLHRIPRYRQRIERTPIEDHPIWVDDDCFNIHYHVRHSSLPAPGDVRQLKRLSARILSQQLDLGKPLWEIWVVEGLQDDRFALVTKVHHCMIDGISGVDLLQVLLSLTPEKEVEPGPRYFPRPPPSEATLVRDAVLHRLGAPLSALLGTATRALRDPDGLRRDAEDALTGVVSNLLAGLKPTTETPLNQQVGPHRRFDGWSVELAEVKRIKNRLGGTVNDVVLAVVAGAVRRFLARRGLVAVSRPDFEFRVICPVSVRSADDGGTLGNRVASMIVKLPVAEPDPAERLREVHSATAEVKEQKQALGGEVLAGVSDMTAPTLMTLGMRMAFDHRSSNMTVTNVPGPQIPLYMLGARMLETYPMGPLFETQGLGVALFSYADALYWGIYADWELVPDLHDFVEDVELSFQELLETAEAAGGEG